MLLSKPQKSLLNILRQFGAIREEQAEKILKQTYPNVQFNVITHQLVCGGLITKSDGFIHAREGALDMSIVTAIDIMLLLEPVHIEVMQRGCAPFDLTFFKERQGKLWRYDICSVKSGKEPLICAALEGINHKYRMIVFVIDSFEQQKILKINCEHCFALKNKNTYKFYK